MFVSFNILQSYISCTWFLALPARGPFSLLPQRKGGKKMLFLGAVSPPTPLHATRVLTSATSFGKCSARIATATKVTVFNACNFPFYRGVPRVVAVARRLGRRIPPKSFAQYFSASTFLQFEHCICNPKFSFKNCTGALSGRCLVLQVSGHCDAV